jgi:site-specific DNA recombinase
MGGRAPYARFSDDRPSDSIPNQKLEEQEYFDRQGWPWDESLFFADSELSASKYATKPRPGYLDLLSATRTGRVELILVTEVSRLCRSLVDAVELIALARESNPFRTVETTGGTRYDLTTVQGEHNFLEDVVGASRESGNTSDRVKRSKRARAREGLWPGGSRPYGYRRVPEFNERGEVINRGRLVIVPEEAAIIRELVARVLHGEPLVRLVHELNARGVPTATGSQWTTSTIRKLLRSHTIKGVRVHLGVEYPATWPAIVSVEDWERVQLILEDAARYVPVASRQGWRSYLLTGFVVCGVPIGGGMCGAKLAGGATRGPAEPTAKRRYKCRRLDNTGEEHGCGKLGRLADPVDLAVSESVLARYSSDDLAALLSPDAPEELHELAASLVEDKARLDEATRDRYRRKGDPLRLDPARYAAIRAEIEDAMEMARSRMARLEQGRVLASIPPGMTLRQAWDAADLNWRRTILSLVVDKVILRPGYPGRRLWPAADSPLLERAKALGGPWCFNPSKVDIKWKV